MQTPEEMVSEAILKIRNDGKREGAIEAYTWVLNNLGKMDLALMREHINAAIKHMSNLDVQDED